MIVVTLNGPDEERALAGLYDTAQSDRLDVVITRGKPLAVADGATLPVLDEPRHDEPLWKRLCPRCGSVR